MLIAEVRTSVGDLVTHTFSSSDAIDIAINTAVEYIGHTVAALYDEERWRHTIIQADIDDDLDNWQLPDYTQYIRKGTLIDPTGTEKIYYPLEANSPDDQYSLDKMDVRGRPAFLTNYYEPDLSGSPRMGIFEGFSRSGYAERIDKQGRPRLVYRVNNNAFVFPRPGQQELNHILELFLQMYPQPLSDANTSNTISLNYPYALIHYTVGILWATKLGNPARAQASIQIAASMLNNIASKQEISKLINLGLKAK